MKGYYLTIFTLMLSAVWGYCANLNHEDLKLVRLTENNFVNIKGPITDTNVDYVIKEMYKIEDDTIYLYFDTPGGSIMDGNEIINTIDTLTHTGKTIVGIADIAISMGFIIFQHCPTRYVRPRAVLMQHQMSTGIHGQFENIKTKLQFMQELDDQLSQAQAERLQLSLDEFNLRTAHDWWMYGNNIIKYKAADEMVVVSCDSNFSNETIKVKQMSMFGAVDITYSKCPLIKQPISIVFDHSNCPSFDTNNINKTDCNNTILNTVDDDPIDFLKTITKTYNDEPIDFLKSISHV